MTEDFENNACVHLTGVDEVCLASGEAGDSLGFVDCELDVLAFLEQILGIIEGLGIKIGLSSLIFLEADGLLSGIVAGIFLFSAVATCLA